MKPSAIWLVPAREQEHSHTAGNVQPSIHPVERGQAPLSWALYLVQQIERWKMNSVDVPEGIMG